MRVRHAFIVSWCAAACVSTPAPAPAPRPTVTPEPTQPRDPRIGKVPAVRFPQERGPAVEVASFRGRVVLVELRSPDVRPGTRSSRVWQPCLEAHPEALVVVVAGPRRDLELERLLVHSVPDPDGVVALGLGVRAFPAMVALDQEGRTASIVEGRMPTEDELCRTIESLLSD